MEPSFAPVQHHEFRDIFSQPFLSFKQRAEHCDVEKIPRKSFGRFTDSEGKAKTKSDEPCVASKPVYSKAEFSKYD